MAAVLKLLALAFAFAFALASLSAAETHHVVGGPDFNVTAWLLGRRFTVGDKIRTCPPSSSSSSSSLHVFLYLRRLDACHSLNMHAKVKQRVVINQSW